MQDALVQEPLSPTVKDLSMAVVALPPLEKLDPAEAWKPWRPDAKDPWDLRWAGHLCSRFAERFTFRETASPCVTRL